MSVRPLKFPSKGYCRIPTCREFFDRKSGRQGLCNYHYTELQGARKKFGDQRHILERVFNEAYPNIFESPIPFYMPPKLNALLDRIHKRLAIDENMSESDFSSFLCRELREKGHHVQKCNPADYQPGVPDLLIHTQGGHRMWRELKSKDGAISMDQIRYMQDLESDGEDVGIWEPDDWTKGKIFSELQPREEAVNE